VLLFLAEDSLAVVRQRLEGIAAAAQVPFDSLPAQNITAPSFRLDTPLSARSPPTPSNNSGPSC
jgi:hypothetical protein